MINEKGQFVKGNTPHNKGVKKRTNTGKTHFKKGNLPTFSEEHRRKLSEAQKGKKPTPETLEKLRTSHLGQTPWNRGKKKNTTYLTLFERYTTEWKETLRRSIRERDKYTCKFCGVSQGDIAHSVHHIDYDKKNNSPENLTTLCFSCHGKTNYNRDKWVKYFKQIYAVFQENS